MSIRSRPPTNGAVTTPRKSWRIQNRPPPPLGFPKGGSKKQSLQRPWSLLKGISMKPSFPPPPPPKPKQRDWLGRKRSSLMVVASLIATVAFQAAITPPGGVWQDDLTSDENGNPVESPHKAGTAIMAYNGKDTYGFYMISNTVSFLASLSIILLLVSGLPIKKRRWMWIQMVTMWIAITALVITYFISLRNMSILDKKIGFGVVVPHACRVLRQCCSDEHVDIEEVWLH